MTSLPHNKNDRVVKGFGEEWSRFTQRELLPDERQAIFEDYFSIFSWDTLPVNASGADIGCGSGRWAMLVAPLVGELHLVDASAAALDVARRNLDRAGNVRFHHASVDELPFAEGSLDFAYSLGVLHHVPDTLAALRSVARVLKPGAPLLVYLYYAFDNRPQWFRALWRLSDWIRRVISRLPVRPRNAVCDVIAVTVYWPLARLAKVLDGFGLLPTAWPLAAYRDRSFYTLRTDALDHFGTRIEQRFTRTEIEAMLRAGGFDGIRFSDRLPYWCAVGVKAGYRT